MSLINKLTAGESRLTKFDGTLPKRSNLKQSNLHYEYSTEGIPAAMNVNPKNGILPQPSQLDMRNPPKKYMNNLPI